jgi:ketosteroid isomerase-like protein
MSQSIEENVDVIRRGFESINRVGPDGAREFMDADIVLEMPEGLIDAGSYHGREALMRVWHAYSDEFEDFRWEVERLFGVEDRVFLRVRERGRGRQSGAGVDWQRWWVYTLRAGLIVRAQFCLDESTALEAAGASAETGAGPRPSSGEGDAAIFLSRAPIAQPDRATPS